MADRNSLGRLRMDASLKNEAEYVRRLEKLQKRMLTIQQAYFHQGRRAVVLFEG